MLKDLVVLTVLVGILVFLIVANVETLFANWELALVIGFLLLVIWVLWEIKNT
jgi:hypothetical protein